MFILPVDVHGVEVVVELEVVVAGVNKDVKAVEVLGKSSEKFGLDRVAIEGEEVLDQWLDSGEDDSPVQEKVLMEEPVELPNTGRVVPHPLHPRRDGIREPATDYVSQLLRFKPSY